MGLRGPVLPPAHVKQCLVCVSDRMRLNNDFLTTGRGTRHANKRHDLVSQTGGQRGSQEIMSWLCIEVPEMLRVCVCSLKEERENLLRFTC